MTILKHNFFAISKMVQKTLSQRIKKLIFGLKKKIIFGLKLCFFHVSGHSAKCKQQERTC